jgi:hypothetical protein
MYCGCPAHRRDCVASIRSKTTEPRGRGLGTHARGLRARLPKVDFEPLRTAAEQESAHPDRTGAAQSCASGRCTRLPPANAGSGSSRRRAQETPRPCRHGALDKPRTCSTAARRTRRPARAGYRPVNSDRLVANAGCPRGRQRPDTSQRGRSFPSVAGLRRLLRGSATQPLRRATGRFGGLLGLAQRSQPRGLFTLGDQAGLVVRHGLGGLARLDFLFFELEFRPFPGLFRRRCQCCFPYLLDKIVLD